MSAPATLLEQAASELQAGGDVLWALVRSAELGERETACVALNTLRRRLIELERLYQLYLLEEPAPTPLRRAAFAGLVLSGEDMLEVAELVISDTPANPSALEVKPA